MEYMSHVLPIFLLSFIIKITAFLARTNEIEEDEWAAEQDFVKDTGSD